MVFITEISLRTYLTAKKKVEDKKPVHCCHYKSHIIKVMFLAADAHPCFNDNSKCTFDSKIDIHPIVEHVQAQKSSIYHLRGTLEWKPKSLTREMYTDIVINKVLPDAIAKWPQEYRVQPQTIYIQPRQLQYTLSSYMSYLARSKNSDP